MQVKKLLILEKYSKEQSYNQLSYLELTSTTHFYKLTEYSDIFVL